MNTLKLHEGRLENLNDLTGYRDFDVSLLPLPERAINDAVRDAVYVPLAPKAVAQPAEEVEGSPTPTPTSMLTSTPTPTPTPTLSAERTLRPKPGPSSGNARRRGGPSPQPRRRRTSRKGKEVEGRCRAGANASLWAEMRAEARRTGISVGLAPTKEWESFLLPKDDRYMSMAEIRAEIQRLEALCRRRGQDPYSPAAAHWIWPAEIPVAHPIRPASVPDVTVWRINDTHDDTGTQDMEMDMSGPAAQPHTQHTHPSAMNTHQHAGAGAGGADSYPYYDVQMELEPEWEPEPQPQLQPHPPPPPQPLPSFQTLMQRTFAGIDLPMEQKPLSLRGMLERTPGPDDFSPAARGFPGPLKSRHELDSELKSRHELDSAMPSRYEFGSGSYIPLPGVW